MSDCKCDMRTRLVGDGCEQCNPEMAVEMLRGTVEDLREEIARLRLTDAEREVLGHEVELAEYQQRHDLVALLRDLLERLK